MRKLLKSTIGAMAVGLGMMMVVGCSTAVTPEVPTYTVTLETPFEWNVDGVKKLENGKYTFTGKAGDALPTPEIPAELKFGQWYTLEKDVEDKNGKNTKITERKLEENLTDKEKESAVPDKEGEIAVKSGITFAGWYDESNKLVTAITPNLNGKTLTAKWSGYFSNGYCGSIECSSKGKEGLLLTLDKVTYKFVGDNEEDIIGKIVTQEN